MKKEKVKGPTRVEKYICNGCEYFSKKDFGFRYEEFGHVCIHPAFFEEIETAKGEATLCDFYNLGAQEGSEVTAPNECLFLRRKK